MAGKAKHTYCPALYGTSVPAPVLGPPWNLQTLPPHLAQKNPPSQGGEEQKGNLFHLLLPRAEMGEPQPTSLRPRAPMCGLRQVWICGGPSVTEFPTPAPAGCPVVKTVRSQCRGHGSIPGQGTKIPHAAQRGRKKRWSC